MATNASASTLYFDPDLHPHDTLRTFDEFIQSFTLQYDAQYHDPPKVSLDAAISRWKLINDDKKPTVDDYDNIRDEWRSKDRVAILLGIFSSKRLLADWKVAEPDESKKKQSDVGIFCIDHAKTLQTNRKSYTKEPPVPIFDTGSP